MNIHDRILWSHLKLRNATVSVGDVQKDYCTVFQVKSLVDLGLGRKTVMLDPLTFPELEDTGALYRDFPKNKLSIPKKLSNLKFVCTSKGFTAMPSMYAAVRHMQINMRLGLIDPDVVAPGDYVMFEHSRRSLKPKFSRVLRVVERVKKRTGHNHDAL